MSKIKVSDLTPRQLNYAVCAVEGKALRQSQGASHAEVAARLADGPFTMYEIVHTQRGGKASWGVGPITVTGVGRQEDPSARCIQFTSQGQRCLGSANQYFFTEEEARNEALIWTEGMYTGYGFDHNWHQAGPIIEREGMTVAKYVRPEPGKEWFAHPLNEALNPMFRCAEGPTPLIAAMRCYVAAKLGDEVEIPEVLA